MRRVRDEPDVRAAGAELTDAAVRAVDALATTCVRVVDRCPAWFEERPLRVLRGSEYALDPLATVFGVNLQVVDEAPQLTSVDRLFDALRGPDTLRERPPIDAVRAYANARAAAQQRIAVAAEAGLSVADTRGQVVHAGTLTGTPLLILNALGQPVRFWRWLLLHLGETHRILLWSPPPPGSGPERPVSLKRQLEDLPRELDAAAVGRCHLLAWCTGAKTALALHARAPGRFPTTTLISGAYKNWPETGKRDTPWESAVEKIVRKVSATPRLAAQYAAIVRKLSGETERTPAQVRDDALLGLRPLSLQDHLQRPYETALGTLRYFRQLADFWDHDLRPGLRAASGRFLLVSGAADSIASPALHERLATMLESPSTGGSPRQAEHVVLPGTGHYALVEDHEELAELVLAHTHP
jgi:pimeloyl-ACP methyl ester carboxylesterase